MPPRHAYWTIILEGKPTAFRSHTREELAPTLRQLQARHPDAVLMWFARGRLWQSPEHQSEEMLRKARERERRGPAWRPGGTHRDPRERFKVPRDEKRRRFAERLRRDHTERADGEAPKRPDHPDRRPDWRSEKRPPRRPGPGPGERPPWRRDEPDRPQPDRPREDRPERRDPKSGRDQRSDRRPSRPQKPGDNRGGGFRKPGGGRPGGGRPGGGRGGSGGGGRGGPRGGGRGGRGGGSSR